MDASRIVPSVSPAEAEEFYTTGTAAYPGHHPQPNQNQNLRIDVPGWGVVDSHRLPSLQQVSDVINAQKSLEEQLLAAKGQSPIVGDAKTGLDGLIGELLFASRILAEVQIEQREPWLDEPAPFRFCRECLMGTLTGKGIPHTAGCRAGRVLRLLDAIVERQAEQENVAQAEQEKAKADEGREKAEQRGDESSLAVPSEGSILDGRVSVSKTDSGVFLCSGDRAIFAVVLGTRQEVVERAFDLARNLNFCSWLRALLKAERGGTQEKRSWWALLALIVDQFELRTGKLEVRR